MNAVDTAMCTTWLAARVAKRGKSSATGICASPHSDIGTPAASGLKPWSR